MINGDDDRFISKLWSGMELIFVYNGKKYFAQGITDDEGKYVFGIQMWETEEKLLWEIEKYTEWVDE